MRTIRKSRCSTSPTSVTNCCWFTSGRRRIANRHGRANSISSTPRPVFISKSTRTSRRGRPTRRRSMITPGAADSCDATGGRYVGLPANITVEEAIFGPMMRVGGLAVSVSPQPEPSGVSGDLRRCFGVRRHSLSSEPIAATSEGCDATILGTGAGSCRFEAAPPHPATAFPAPATPQHCASAAGDRSTAMGIAR